MSSDEELYTDISEDTDEEVREPDMWRVILLNDHYTTMDFVVRVIRTVFHKNLVEATKIMMDVHRKGRGQVGVFTYDIARTKIVQVEQLARQEEFPLKCTIEKA